MRIILNFNLQKKGVYMVKAKPLETYKTQQKEILLNFLKSHKSEHFTIGQICDALKKFNIGNSTIYRLVNSLAEQEKLRCFADGKTHLMNYQYLDVGCQNHLHLKCERCGNVTHLSYEESAAFTDNIYRNHKFDIDIKDTFFYGTCENCADNQ